MPSLAGSTRLRQIGAGRSSVLPRSTRGTAVILFLPLPARDDAAISLMSTKPGAFSGTSYDVVLLFTLHAGVAFDNAQLFHDSKSLVDQLHKALETWGLIGRAQGILMHHYGLTTDVAFQVLKRGSQTANLKLRELAGALVQGQEQGALRQTLAKHGLATGALASD